jgi:hypothetical protein
LAFDDNQLTLSAKASPPYYVQVCSQG